MTARYVRNIGKKNPKKIKESKRKEIMESKEITNVYVKKHYAKEIKGVN